MSGVMPSHYLPTAARSSALDSASATADLAHCCELLNGGSRSFYAASKVLPQQVRDDATALYAFCRVADDAIDNTSSRADALHALDQLQLRLDHMLTGRPHAHAVDRAFARVLARHAIPAALPRALLEGFAWDVTDRRYQTLEELHDYAARVAGSVGAMMALIMGVRAPQVVARACDLGVAMQLTNIARDVGEDAGLGRLYLPRLWLQAAGIDAEQWLAQPRFDARLAQVVQQLLDAAEPLYQRAAVGIDALPWACRPSMHAARLLYAEIGREVERRGLDSVSQRAVVASKRKKRLLLTAIANALWLRPAAEAPALAATQFLVKAVAAMPLPSVQTDTTRTDNKGIDHKRVSPWRWLSPRYALSTIEQRFLWVLDLFERLERRERLQRLGQPLRLNQALENVANSAGLMQGAETYRGLR